MDLLIKGGTLITPAGECQADLGVRDGKISVIGSDLPGTEAEQFIDGRHDRVAHFRDKVVEDLDRAVEIADPARRPSVQAARLAARELVKAPVTGDDTEAWVATVELEVFLRDLIWTS